LLLFLLLAAGCAGFPVKRPDREVLRLFILKTSPHSGFDGYVVYNGEMACGDSGFPFIMGASVDGSAVTLNFYAYSGDLLFRAHQVGFGSEYQITIEEPGSRGQSVDHRVYRFLRDMGGALSVKGLISGRLPFEKREGELFHTRKGFLYEGEDFCVVADIYMRVLSVDYRRPDFSIKVSYAYPREDEDMPSALDIFSLGCSFRLEVEKFYRGVGRNG
jgi:hypothetical protein